MGTWVAVGNFQKTSSDRVHCTLQCVISTRLGSKFSNKVNYKVTTRTDIPH